MTKPLYLYASEVAACIGRNPYKTPKEAFAAIYKRYDAEDYEKRGLVSEADVAKKVLEATPGLNRVLHETARETHTTEGIEAKVKEVAALVPKTASAQEAKAAKDFIRSSIFTSLGCNRETPVFDRLEGLLGQPVDRDAALHKAKMGTLKNGIPWFVCGRIDGLAQDGSVVEIKNRVRKLFNKVPDYELVQIMCYMNLLKSPKGFLVESFEGDASVHEVAYDEEAWKDIVGRMESALETFFSELKI